MGEMLWLLLLLLLLLPVRVVLLAEEEPKARLCSVLTRAFQAKADRGDRADDGVLQRHEAVRILIWCH